MGCDAADEPLRRQGERGAPPEPAEADTVKRQQGGPGQARWLRTGACSLGKTAWPPHGDLLSLPAQVSLLPGHQLSRGVDRTRRGARQSPQVCPLAPACLAEGMGVRVLLRALSPGPPAPTPHRPRPLPGALASVHARKQHPQQLRRSRALDLTPVQAAPLPPRVIRAGRSHPQPRVSCILFPYNNSY